MADDNNNSPFADDPVPDPDYVPAARTGLTATGQFSTILLKWDHPPNQVDSVNLAYVEVYRSATNVRPIPPDGLIAQVRGTSYGDTPPEPGTWYYWIRAVSKHNVAGPFNDDTLTSTAGDDATPGTAGDDEPSGDRGDDTLFEDLTQWDPREGERSADGVGPP